MSDELMKWTKKRWIAATLVAEGGLPDEKIAQLAKVPVTTLTRLRKNPVFVARVDELIAAGAPEKRRAREARAKRNSEILGRCGDNEPM